MGAFSLHVFKPACARASRECMEKKMRSLFMHGGGLRDEMGTE